MYGLFLAISTNVAILATAGYHFAFILPAREDHFRELFRGTLMILLSVVVVSMLLVPFHNSFYTLVPGWGILGPWALLLPLSILLQGLLFLFGQSAGRYKQFTVNTTFNAAFNVVVRVFNALFGWVSSGAIYGLILSEVMVRGVLLGLFIKPLRSFGLGKVLTLRKPGRAIVMLRLYSRYPRFVLPTRFLGLLFGQLPLYFLATDKNPASIGQYAMATAMLVIPLRLFGHGLTTMFMQKANETLRSDPNKLASITSRLFDRLMIIGIVPFAVLIVFGDLIFSMFLGADWAEAGVFSSLLGLYFFFRLLSEPMESMFSVLSLERRLFLFHFANVVLAAVSLYFGLYVLKNVNQALMLFGATGAFMYGYLSAHILHLSGVPWRRKLINSLLLLAVAVVLCSLLRNVLFGGYTMEYW